MSDRVTLIEEHLRQPCQVEFGKLRARFLVGDIELELCEMLSPCDR